MNEIINCNIKSEIYKNHLKEMDNIYFTAREIDIIACFIHNRDGQNIASILSISSRTVAAHIYNVRMKLGYISKGKIIDFVEKSGKLQYLKQYYYYLVLELSFEQKLKKIGALINLNNITFSTHFEKINDTEDKLLNHIIYCLKLANITLLKDKHKVSQNNLYIINDSDFDGNSKSSTDIFLLFCDEDIDISAFKNLNYINFCLKTNFYFSVFKLIEKIISHKGLAPIIAEFENEYKELQNSWKRTHSIIEPFSSKNDTDSLLHKPQLLFTFKNGVIPIAIISAVL